MQLIYREVQKEIQLENQIVIEKLPAGLKVYGVGTLKNVEPGTSTTIRKGQSAITITIPRDGSVVEITPVSENPNVLFDRDADSNKFFIGLKIRK